MTTHTMSEEEVAEAQANAASSVADPSRPSWLPEKFKSPEDMAKAYGELEGKLGGEAELPSEQEPEDNSDPKDEAPAPEGDEVTDGEGEGSEDDTLYGKAINGAMVEAGLDPQVLADEWQEKGEVSEEHLAKLNETFGEANVAQWIAGAKARVAEAAQTGEAKGPTADEQTTIIESAGGQEQFNELLAWAGTNLSDDDFNFFNDQVQRDAGAARMAVQWLAGKHAAEEGKPPELRITGDKSSKSTRDVYQSMAEVTRDMAARDAQGNILYQTDKAYRAKVHEKLARSHV